MTLAEFRQISACSLETAKYRKYQILGKLSPRCVQCQVNLFCSAGKAAIATHLAHAIFDTFDSLFAAYRGRIIPSYAPRHDILVWPLDLHTVSYDNNAGPLLNCSAQGSYGTFLNGLRALIIKMRNDPAMQ